MTTPEKSRLTYVHETIASTDGVTTFNVTASFTPIEGDLPAGVTGVFVRRAVLPTDPKSDVFVRVAMLSDMGTAASSREVAIDPARFSPAAGTFIKSRTGTTGMYLTSTITLAFDSLPVAIKAKKILEQRVDTLISDWKLYLDTFYATTSVDFPIYSDSLVQEAKAAYYTAAAAYDTADTSATEAQNLLTAAAAAYQTKSLELARIQGVRDDLIHPSADIHLPAFTQSYGDYFAANGGRSTLREALIRLRNPTTLDSTFKQVVLTALTELSGLTESQKTSITTTVEGLFSDSPLSTASDELITDALVTEGDDFSTLSRSYSDDYVRGAGLASDASFRLNAQWESASSAQAAALASTQSAQLSLARAQGTRAKAAEGKATALAYVMSVCPSFVP